ncbi:MAG: hypothetical protein LBQ51_03005, partial [Desulfovibrio sp.]|nr:hypothetical protein [Desulfovibrio sp.]
MDKSDVRALPLEEALEGVYKHRVGAHFLDAAGLTNRKHAFDKPLAFFAACAKTAFAPNHGKTKHA